MQFVRDESYKESRAFFNVSNVKGWQFGSARVYNTVTALIPVIITVVVSEIQISIADARQLSEEQCQRTFDKLLL